MADTSLIFNIIGRDRASRAMGKVSDRAKVLGAAIGLLAVKVGKDSVAAYVDAEKAQTRLADAFAKFPALADTNIGRLRELNTTLAQKTRFDDDATASGQAVLAQFGLTGKQLESLTPLLQDYAAKTGQDMPTAATSFGKALLGNTRALKTIGINYKMTGDKTQDYANITELMRQKVGGFAEKEGKTAAGQAEILRNQFGELEESLGSKLVPVLMKLGAGLLKVIGFIQKHKSTVVPLTAAIAALAVTVWSINKATAAWAAITKASIALSKAQLVIGKAVTVATKAWAAAQWLLNIALTANPIGLVIAAIALLVVGIIIAWKKSETFRNVVTKVFVAVGMAAVKMALVWLSALGKVFGALGKIPGKLGAPFRAAADAIDKARGKVLQLQASLNRLKSKSVTVKVFGAGEARAQVMALNAALRATSGAHVSIGGVGTGISERASGGPIVKGQTYLTGEKGPELITAGSNGYVHNAAATARMGGGGDTVYLQPLTVMIGDDAIHRSLLRTKRKNGGSLPGITA